MVKVYAEPAFQRLMPRFMRAGAALLRLRHLRRASFEIYLVGNRVFKKNVRSYPAPPYFPRPDLSGRFLGEIYVNPREIARRKEDLMYMLVHGFLHLLHYDHVKRNDRIIMEREERRLLARCNDVLSRKS